MNALALCAADIFALALSLLCARSLVAPEHPSSNGFLVAYGVICALSLAMFALNGYYSRRLPFWNDLKVTLHYVGLGACVHGLITVLADVEFAKSIWLLTWGLALVLVPLGRYLVKQGLRSLGFWQRYTVIIGTGQQAVGAAKALLSEPMLGFTVGAFIHIDETAGHPPFIQVMGSQIAVISVAANELLGVLESMGRPHMVMAMEHGDVCHCPAWMDTLILHYPDMNIIPPLPGLPLFGMELNYFFSHDVLMLRVRNNLAIKPYVAIKRMFDIVVSAGLLVLLSPVFAYVAWQIKRSGGEVFFSHARVGQGGRLFPCFKFRTMVPNAEQVLAQLLERDSAARGEWERDFKLRADPRITPIGAFLRTTSLDELPQLWNVLRGDMSLVGPRPVIQDELARYGEKAAYYLEAKPGITGMWQVSGRNDTDYTERVNLDTWYVKNWNLWYDVAILFKTFRVVFARKGAY